jgi:uncharacterized membrane protein YbhN (UPF0104 family)
MAKHSKMEAMRGRRIELRNLVRSYRMFGHEPPEGLTPVQKAMAAYDTYLAAIIFLILLGGSALVVLQLADRFGTFWGTVASVLLFVAAFFLAIWLLNFISRRIRTALEEVRSKH